MHPADILPYYQGGWPLYPIAPMRFKFGVALHSLSIDFGLYLTFQYTILVRNLFLGYYE